MSVGLKYTDCFTSVVDKVKTLIKTVCCLFAVGLRRVNGRRESWQLRKAQGSPAFQHIVLVSDSARRESSARSGAGSIGWVVHLLKTILFFLPSVYFKVSFRYITGFNFSSFISYCLVSRVTAHGPILGHIDQR